MDLRQSEEMIRIPILHNRNIIGEISIVRSHSEDVFKDNEVVVGFKKSGGEIIYAEVAELPLKKVIQSVIGR